MGRIEIGQNEKGERRKSQVLYGGLMSGTSADGIDAVVVTGGKRPGLVAHAQKAYSTGLRQAIFKAFEGSIRLEELIHLNVAVGEVFALAMKAACRKAEIKTTRLTCVGSHGQTLWHSPKQVERFRWRVAGSLQVGEGAILASRLGVPVVTDFRAADMAEGGQGAPLIPWAHARLLGIPGKRTLAVNLGGIANLTLISGNKAVKGFDVGPGNMLLDGLCQAMTHGRLSYDKGGGLAVEGISDSGFLSLLRKHPFLKKSPPKSTGREDFGSLYLARVLEWVRARKLSLPTALRTLCDFTSSCLADQVQRHCGGIQRLDRMVVHGGGLENLTLMAAIRDAFQGVSVIGSDTLGWPSQVLEPTAFALMAAETLQGRASGLPKATGAKIAGLLGKICLPPCWNPR